jgi:hypothetical protein
MPVIFSKYLSEYQPARIRSASSLKLVLASRWLSKMLMVYGSCVIVIMTLLRYTMVWGMSRGKLAGGWWLVILTNKEGRMTNFGGFTPMYQHRSACFGKMIHRGASIVCGGCLAVVTCRG